MSYPPEEAGYRRERVSLVYFLLTLGLFILFWSIGDFHKVLDWVAVALGIIFVFSYRYFKEHTLQEVPELARRFINRVFNIITGEKECKKGERLKIYVAGPYSSDKEKEKLSNTKKAMDAGLEIYKLGHYPFVPHLTHFIDERAEETGVKMEWQDYIIWDMKWLDECDAFLYLDSSPGVKKELKQAQKKNMKIFENIDRVPDVGSHDKSNNP